MAMRYGIGVGREGFSWSGDAVIQRKAEWPKWTPPAEMVARDPKAAEWANGLPGGLSNPLGARALYLFQGNRDTLYRIHGTTEPYSIGTNVSSGCIRLINQDIVDLYSRVPVGTRVVVLPADASFIADTGETVIRGFNSMTQLL
jgi:lipoprotein-anchoring transpeptidase ErfK/SrfK